MLPEHVKETIERWAAGQGWTSKCVSKLLEGDPEHVLQGLVTQNGDKPIPWKNGMWDVWGIDLATCREFCSRAKFGMVSDLQLPQQDPWFVTFSFETNAAISPCSNSIFKSSAPDRRTTCSHGSA
jgi:hypothetical protein